MTDAVSWQTDTDSRTSNYVDGSATSGGGAITFAFGGNPNLALLNSGSTGNLVKWGAIAVAAVAALLALRAWTRRR